MAYGALLAMTLDKKDPGGLDDLRGLSIAPGSWGYFAA
jgi:hypothetical protein